MMPHDYSLGLTRELTTRYIIALSIVGLLSLVAWISLRAVIKQQGSSAAIINISGKMRYLSHRIALFSEQLQSAPQTDAVRDKLLLAIETMSVSYHGLRNGDESLGLPKVIPPAVEHIYATGEPPLTQLIEEFIERARRCADAQHITASEVAWLSATATGPLLAGLDAVVAAYQKDNEKRVAYLQNLEDIIFFFTLVVLVLEAAFIFRPMVAHVLRDQIRARQAEETTRTVWDNSYDAIVAVNGDGVIIAANLAAQHLAGQDKKSLEGQPFSMFQLDMTLPKLSDIPHTAVASVLRQSDGVYFDVGFTTARLAGSQVIIVNMRQSTERLQHYARELEIRNKELDQFAYVASHDLKAPLRAIANLSSWIVEDMEAQTPTSAIPATPQIKQYVQQLQSRVQLMEKLINALHSYATVSRQVGKIETIDTRLLAQEIIEEQRQGLMVHMNKDIQFFLEGEFPVIQSDRIRLWQVLSNLIGNAIKHHDKAQGRVTVSAMTANSVKGQQKDVLFTISDDGPGIAEQHHQRIFTMFQRLSPKTSEGIGLGLALVEKIVREAGGFITVESQLGQGAQFRFSWPLVHNPHTALGTGAQKDNSAAHASAMAQVAHSADAAKINHLHAATSPSDNNGQPIPPVISRTSSRLTTSLFIS
jgi:signal transduction histidine kinase